MILSSHLCILSKEPVLVTTLHSQQGIIMLLFQLDDLLLQRSEHTLRTSGWSARVWRRIQLCSPSSPTSTSWLGKLREAEPLEIGKKKPRLLVNNSLPSCQSLCLFSSNSLCPDVSHLKHSVLHFPLMRVHSLYLLFVLNVFLLDHCCFIIIFGA